MFNVHTLLSKEHLEIPIFKTEVNKTKRRSKKAYYLESFDHKVVPRGHWHSLNCGAGETKDSHQEKLCASLQQFRFAYRTQEILSQMAHVGS